MDPRTRLLDLLATRSARRGTFTLASGLPSPTYSFHKLLLDDDGRKLDLAYFYRDRDGAPGTIRWHAAPP